MFVHPLMTVKSGPGQGFSTNCGSGLTHRLTLNCMPLMFFVQWLHWLQSLQPPSTATKNIKDASFSMLDVDLCIG